MSKAFTAHGRRLSIKLGWWPREKQVLQTLLCARSSANSWSFAFESKARAASRAPSRQGAQQRAFTPSNSWIGSPTATQTAQPAASSGSVPQAPVQHQLLLQLLHLRRELSVLMHGCYPGPVQIQVQSAQISDLMQIVKGLGRLQDRLWLLLRRPSAQAEEKTGDESASIEVDKDTGGVRHAKAEQYLPMLNTRRWSRSSKINYWTEYVEAISSWLALLDDFCRALHITDSIVRQNALERSSCKKLEISQQTQAEPGFFPAWSGCCATSRTAVDGCSVWV